MTEIDILGLQQRMRQLGEIRIGHTIDTGKVSEKTGKPILRPAKLDKFRLTSASKPTLEEVARLYGGTVQPWTPPNGDPPEWQVYTETDRIPVIIPPERAVSRCYEQYQSSKCVRRCDGRIEQKSDRACMCDPDNRTCQVTIRLNVMLRDVNGLGLWLLTSHGINAAEELPPVVNFLSRAGGYVDAFLTMELKRVPQDDGPPFEFMVPKVDVMLTPAQVLAGQGAISAPAIAATRHRSAVAIGSGADTDFLADIAIAVSRKEVLDLWQAAKDARVPNGREIEDAAKARIIELEQRAQTAQPTKPSGPTGADEVRGQIIKAALACETADQLTAALAQAQAAGFATDLGDQSDVVAQAFVGRRRLLATELQQQTPPAATPGGDVAEVAECDRLWAEIVTAAGIAGFARTDEVVRAFASRWNGDEPSDASASQLATFLEELRAGKIQPPRPVQPAQSQPASDDERAPF